MRDRDPKKLLLETLAPAMDRLVQDAIWRTPNLREENITKLQKRGSLIIHSLARVFPPSPLEKFFLWHKRTGFIVLFFCLLSASVILRSGPDRLTLIGQVLLACIVGLLGAWCIYFVSIISKLASFGLSAALGLASFIGMFSWWASPWSPVKAKPQVLVEPLQATSSKSNPAFGAELQGQALLPPRTHLWIYAGSQNKWRPVSEIKVKSTGYWQSRVHPEAFRYLGCNVRIAVVALNQSDHQKAVRDLQASSSPQSIPTQNISQQAIEKEFEIPLPNCKSPATTEMRTNKSTKNYPWPGEMDMSLNFLRPTTDAKSWNNRAEEASSKIALNKKDTKAYNDRGYALSMLGNQDEAEQMFEKSIEITPSRNGYNGHGLVFLRMGRLSEAILEFRKALDYQAQGNDPDPQGTLRMAENIDSNLDDTIAYLNTVAKYRPTDGEVWSRLAKAYEEQGKIDLARECLAKANQR